MFSVIYSFDVKTDSVETFIAAWKKMTVLLYTREGSLGSRLHKVTDNHTLPMHNGLIAKLGLKRKQIYLKVLMNINVL